MKLFSKFIIMFLLSFMYAECSEIDNQEECDRVEGCEWPTMLDGECTEFCIHPKGQFKNK